MPAELRSPFDLSMPDAPAGAPPPPVGERLDAEFDLAYDDAALQAPAAAPVIPVPEIAAAVPEIPAAVPEIPASAPQTAPGPPALRQRLMALPWPRIGQFLALQFFIVVLLVAALPELLPRRSAQRVTVRPATPQSGVVAVAAPRSLPAGALTVSLLRYGGIARAADGTAIKRLPIPALERERLEPALYLAEFEYRGRRVEGPVVHVQPGGRAVLVVPAAALAEIEYRAGLRQARRGGDIPYFRRVLRLDPEHVGAHLQLAAYEVLRGSPRRARRHLAVVRKKEPGNPYAARVARLLQRARGAG